MSFLGEFKRRKVFQVAAVYAVVGWLIIQVVDVIGGPLNLPEWFATVAIVLLAIGFPITVILAWVVDMTPRGPEIDRGQVSAETAAPASGQRMSFAIQGLVLVAVGLLVVDQFFLDSGLSPVAQSDSGNEVIRFDHDLPAGQLLANLGRRAMDLSPDGRNIVYSEAQGLYLRPLDELEARLIPGTEEQDAYAPTFSPDGQSLVYYDQDSELLKRISISGGTPVELGFIHENVDGMSWEADGTILIGRPEGVLRVPATAGMPELIISSLEGFDIHGPRLLPDGNTVIFSETREDDWDAARIVAYSLSTGERSVLVTGGSDARYVASGHLVYALRDGLFAVAFDADSLAVSGGSVPLVQGVMRSSAEMGSANYSLSANGVLTYIPGVAGPPVRTLVWVDREGREEPINVPERPYNSARLSPDNTRVALEVRDEDQDVWIWDLARELLQRLTFDSGWNRLPVWSVDGERVAYSRDLGETWGIYWQAANGSEAEPLVVGSEEQALATGFTPNGETLIYQVGNSVPRALWAIDVGDTARAEEALLDTIGQDSGTVSPDGRWLAYRSIESGQQEVYVREFPIVASTGRTLVSPNGGVAPRWSRDGSELFYGLGAGGGEISLYSVPVTLGPTFAAGTPELLFRKLYVLNSVGAAAYDVSLDGQRFLFVKRIVSVTGERPQLVVVQNWFEELERLVPTQ